MIKNNKKPGIGYFVADHAIIIALIVFWGILILTNPAFSNFQIFATIIKQASIFAVVGIGMTFAVISGAFDLSVASQIALSSVVLTSIVTRITPSNPLLGLIISCLIIIVLGLVMGLINGTLIARLRIPAFITTLAMQLVYRGIAQLVNDSPVPWGTLGSGYQIFTTGVGVPQTIRIGNFEVLHLMGFSFSRIFGLPLFFYIMIILAVIGTIILRKTGLGRNILAIGNSREAARVAGISISKTQTITYVMVGLFTAFAALMMTSHQGMSNFGVPTGTEFTVISAVVLGGTALAGGKGSILNTVIASLFIATIPTALTMFGVNPDSHDIFNGIILVIAFSINTIRLYADDAIVKFRARRKAAVGAVGEQTSKS